MARLRDANPKNVSGSYERLFGDAQLGILISKVQSACIRSGSELERLISDAVPNVSDLDDFLQLNTMPEGVHLARKNQMKSSRILDFPKSAPDFMVFKRSSGVEACHIIEVKDGHVFDNKKALAEHQFLHKFIMRIKDRIPYCIQAHFCAFNQNDRCRIWEGFKKQIPKEEVMTGTELCELLEIDYDLIVNKRLADCRDNVEFFLTEVVKIDRLRPRLTEVLAERDNVH